MSANTDQTLNVPRKMMKIRTKSCTEEAGDAGVWRPCIRTHGHKCFDARRSVSLYIGEL